MSILCVLRKSQSSICFRDCLPTWNNSFSTTSRISVSRPLAFIWQCWELSRMYRKRFMIMSTNTEPRWSSPSPTWECLNLKQIMNDEKLFMFWRLSNVWVCYCESNYAFWNSFLAENQRKFSHYRETSDSEVCVFVNTNVKDADGLI